MTTPRLLKLFGEEAVESAPNPALSRTRGGGPVNADVRPHHRI